MAAKQRALAGAVDQVFASVSNGLILFAIAGSTSSSRFGFLAMLFTLVAAATGVLRGAIGTGLLLRADRGQRVLTADATSAVAAAIVTGLALAPILAASGHLGTGDGVTEPAWLLAAATPFVLAEDVLRYVAIAMGRATVAALWDGLWCLGSGSLLIATWVSPSSLTPATLVASWAALAATAAVGLAVSLRVAPRLAGLGAWIRRGWTDRVRYALDAGLEQTAVFLILVVVSVIINQAAAGALRGAVAALAPVAILAAAIPLVIIPESKRAGLSPASTWRALARIAVITGSLSLVAGIAIGSAPESLGRLLLGDTFSSARTVIIIVAIEYASSAWLASLSTWLRAANRSRDVLTLKIIHFVAALPICAAAAAIFGSAEAVAGGLLAATTTVLGGAMLVLRPWQSRQHPRSLRTESLGTGSTARLPQTRPAGPTIADLTSCWVAIVLGAIIPGIVVIATDVPDTRYWMGPLVITTITALRFGYLVGLGERRLCEMTFWVFTYTFMGLAPLAQLRENSWPDTVPRTDWTLANTATLMVVAGILAFLVGTWCETRFRPPARTTLAATVSSASADDLSYRRVIALAVFSCAFGLFHLSRVGFAQFTMSRTEAIAAFTAAWGNGSLSVIIRSFVGMSLLVSAVALIRVIRILRRSPDRSISDRRRILLATVLTVPTLALLADVMNPVSNARYLSGTSIFAVLAAFGLFATRARFRAMSLGFVAMLVLVFPLADAFRYSSQGTFKSTSPLQSLLSADYDSYAEIVNSLTIAGRDGIVPGRQLVGVLLWWYPRTAWPGKPVDTGIYIANQRGYPFTNLSAPLWAEAFLNGGWIAVLVVFFALGWGLHRWDRTLHRQQVTLGMPGVLGCIVPFYLLILLRGSLLQAMSYLTVVVGCYLLIRRYRPLREVLTGSVLTPPSLRLPPIPAPAHAAGVAR